MAEIVLELIDGDGDTVTVWCQDDGITVFHWSELYNDGDRTHEWSKARDNEFFSRWLGPLIPVIDAAFRELGVKVDG